MSMQRTPEQGGLVTGYVLLALGLLLIVVPSAAGLDGFDGGFALAAFGLLLLAVGAITAAIYAPRVRRLRRLLAQENLLAHWVYDAPQVARQVERDRIAERKRNRGLLLIVLAWLVFWSLLFVVIGVVSGQGEDMRLFVAIMAGVGLVVAAAAFLAPRAHARRALHSSGEVCIGRDGLLLNGAYHAWAGRLARLDGVELVADQPEARLVFRLSILTGPGWLHWAPYVVEAPVPAGEMSAARRVVAELAPR
jgi:drug/metabolite transporter (DMT)-like permease